MSDLTVPELARHDQNLIWVDMEMTGLDPMTDRIIEIAVVVTDAQLTVRVEGPVIAGRWRHFGIGLFRPVVRQGEPTQ